MVNLNLCLPTRPPARPCPPDAHPPACLPACLPPCLSVGVVYAAQVHKDEKHPFMLAGCVVMDGFGDMMVRMCDSINTTSVHQESAVTCTVMASQHSTRSTTFGLGAWQVPQKE